MRSTSGHSRLSALIREAAEDGLITFLRGF